MILAIILIFSIGFYLLYHTSKRVVIRRNKTTRWIQNHSLLSKIIGLGCLIFAFYLLGLCFGTTTGIFFGLLVLMVIASLNILLLPIKNKL